MIANYKKDGWEIIIQRAHGISFLRDQKILRSQWAREIKISTTELKKTYCILEWCDAFSLLLCQCEIPPENREIEISKDKNATPYFLHRMGEDVVTVKPWPFAQESFKVTFESRNLSKLVFKTSDDLRACSVAARPIENTIALIKSKRKQL